MSNSVNKITHFIIYNVNSPINELLTFLSPISLIIIAITSINDGMGS